MLIYKIVSMKKKIYCSTLVLIVAAVITFNLKLNAQGSKSSNMSLANIEALAGENIDMKKCKQGTKGVNYSEPCDLMGRKTTRIGTNYFLIRSDDGFSSVKSGFEGTVTNECASNSADISRFYKAAIVNC